MEINSPYRCPPRLGSSVDSTFSAACIVPLILLKISRRRGQTGHLTYYTTQHLGVHSLRKHLLTGRCEWNGSCFLDPSQPTVPIFSKQRLLRHPYFNTKLSSMEFPKFSRSLSTVSKTVSGD